MVLLDACLESRVNLLTWFSSVGRNDFNVATIKRHTFRFVKNVLSQSVQDIAHCRRIKKEEIRPWLKDSLHGYFFKPIHSPNH